MEANPSPSTKAQHRENELVDHEDDMIIPPINRYQQIISALPFVEWPPRILREYQGFWLSEPFLPAIMARWELFKPRTSDLLIISAPKTGTTWLKALVFAIVTRKDHPFDHHPLLSLHPQDCAPFLERLFVEGQGSKLDALPSPRLLGTHMPYSLLPESITTSSNCRIIYICRDPKDAMVSQWYFNKQMVPETMEPLSFDKFFQLFCKGISSYGPIWNHFLEYWRESLRRPEKILFCRYEDLMEDPVENVRRLAEFIGQPFSQEEERKGVVKDIVRLCSFEKLKSYGGNTRGGRGYNKVVVKNSSFFRKGEVGDWKNHLTPEMAKILDGIIEEKLHGSGLR